MSPAPTSLAIADDWLGLAALFEPRCNMAHVPRELAPEVRVAGEQLAASRWSELKVTLHPEGGPLDLEPLREALTRAAGAEAATEALARDLGQLGEVLRALCDADAIGVRLTRLLRPACPRFHYDRVGLRLVTTYVGPGTEFLPDQWSSSEPRVSTNLGARGNLTSPIGEPGRTTPGDALFLKGTLWPENSDHGAVHRSPAQVEGQPRVVATLDPL